MISATQGATAPSAPGRLGQPLVASEALHYLEGLGTWRDARKAELDVIDEAALGAADSAAYTGDLLLSMALWKAVADRHDLLVATWDSGRVGATELARLSTLVWGRLDATARPTASAAGGGIRYRRRWADLPRIGAPVVWRPGDDERLGQRLVE